MHFNDYPEIRLAGNGSKLDHGQGRICLTKHSHLSLLNSNKPKAGAAL